MSTKIFDAYRMPTADFCGAFVHELGARIETARDELTLVQLMLLVGALENAETYDELADLVAPFGGITGKFLRERVRIPARTTRLQAAALVVDAIDAYVAAGNVVRLSRPFDSGLHIVFLFDPADPSWVYVKFYGEHRSLIDAAVLGTNLADYAYWNNSDRPDGVSEREWDQRRQAWDRVLPGFTPPARVGVAWHADYQRCTVLELRDGRFSAERVASLCKDPDGFIADANTLAGLS